MPRTLGVPCQHEELELQQGSRNIAKIWRQPGSGMWESRDEPRRYTCSGAMAWRAVERAVTSNAMLLSEEYEHKTKR